jgi:hypothetical protein
MLLEILFFNINVKLLATFFRRTVYQSIAFAELYTTQSSAILKNVWLPNFVVVNIASITELMKKT